MQLNTLVLIGGKSTRMGKDKSSIRYKDKTHGVYLADLLHGMGCGKVYFSCSVEQSLTMDFEYPFLEDQYPNVGPIGGILTAFGFTNKKAWLVVGCDYPLLGKELITQLLEQRNMETDATVFRHPESQFLEPLVAIYEPSSFFKIKAAFLDGQYSLRRILETLELNCLIPDIPLQLMNANTPREREQALRHIKKHF